MSGTGKDKLLLFAENAQIIRKKFIWHNPATKRMAALLYALEGRSIDPEEIRRCHDMVKQNTGVFSAFRGNMALCVAALYSLSPNQQGLLDKTLEVYNMLKGVKFRASDYLAVAAYQIASQSDTSGYTNAVTRTRGFYDGMKARHFFYTGQDDYIFAAMLGLTDLDVTTGTERIEQLHNRLKGEFWSKNSVQALAQVLVLGNSDDGASDRVLALRDALRAEKIKLDKSYTLPALGILTLLPVEIDTIVSDLGTAQKTLRAQKGFGSMSVGAQELLLFAASITACAYTEGVKDGLLTATISTSITNIIIAQQAAMIAAVSASTAASAAASS